MNSIAGGLLGLILFIFLAVAIAAVALAIQAGVIWLVWTYLLVAAFNAPALTFLQCTLVAIGLNIVGGVFRGVARASSSK